MTEYTLRWVIQADGDNPRDAAKKVFDQYFQQTGASVFDVQPTTDPLKARWDVVDLLEDPDTDGVKWEYGHRALFAMAQKLVEDGGDLDAVLEMLEKPQKWPELLTAAVLDDAFDAVSPVAEEMDTSDEDVDES